MALSRMHQYGFVGPRAFNFTRCLDGYVFLGDELRRLCSVREAHVSAWPRTAGELRGSQGRLRLRVGQ